MCGLTRSISILLALLTLARSEDSPVAFTWNHQVAGKPLLLSSLRYTNAADEMFSVTRLSYLACDFALETAQGDWVTIPNGIAFIDLGKRRTTARFDQVPHGQYRSLRFAIGLDKGTNHGDPTRYAADHPLNPNLNQLHWDWKAGYIFMAVEGHTRDATGKLAGYVYHLANDHNRTEITLPLSLAHQSNTQIELEVDLAALFNAPQPISFAKDGASTHSHEGDPIAAALRANLPGSLQVRQVRQQTLLDAKPAPKPIDLPSQPIPYRFTLSRRFPIPPLPTDNPLIESRVQLGRRLFHDKQLSANGTIACASCHDTKHAFSDPRVFSIGLHGKATPRHSMPLFNLAWKNQFFWDGRVSSLRDQALHPIQDPVEMGETLPNVIEKLEAEPSYVAEFSKAFGSGIISDATLGLAIENFLLTLTSYDSKFDSAMKGNASLTDAERRGFHLFMTEYEPRSRQYGADCFHCHGGALFTDHQFHNNGLKPTSDRGRSEITGNEAQQDQFSTPSLRNIALTAPYMHDGRFATLEDVIRHYNEGIHPSSSLDPNLAKHPQGGLHLKEDDQAALVAFLRTLTDPQFIKIP